MQRQMPVANMTKPLAWMQFSTRNEERYDHFLSVFDGVEILVQYFVHGEHMNFVLLEHFTHCLIADDVSFVGWIL
jgi:hypothetical protein